jgi:hypothetical protein
MCYRPHGGRMDLFIYTVVYLMTLSVAQTIQYKIKG